MTIATVHVLPSPEAIGEEVGALLLARIEDARRAGRDFLLGCPTGRTPKPIFAAMAQQLARQPQSLRHVTLVMMDDARELDARLAGHKSMLSASPLPASSKNCRDSRTDPYSFPQSALSRSYVFAGLLAAAAQLSERSSITSSSPSSISSCVIWNPHFCRIRIEAKLCFATCA